MKRTSMAALCLALLGPCAQAAQYKFSYNWDDPQLAFLTGVLDGTASATNLIIVNSLLQLNYNGIPATIPGFLFSADDVYGFTTGTAPPPMVSLDGSFMDIAACGDQTCGGDGFTFNAGNAYATTLGIEFFNASTNLGGNPNAPYYWDFDQARWSLTLVDVPVPGILPLMLIGFAAFGLQWRGTSRYLRQTPRHRARYR